MAQTQQAFGPSKAANPRPGCRLPGDGCGLAGAEGRPGRDLVEGGPPVIP